MGRGSFKAFLATASDLLEQLINSINTLWLTLSF
jgi:hypothetical protein